jgi:C-terminal processing protease CtpA/Prc
VTTHFEGNIGGEVLRRFTVYLDYARQEAILEPGPDRDEPFEADMSGAVFISDSAGAGLRVAFVAAGTPAAEAGLAPADLVLAVDGRAAADLGVGAVRALMRQAGTIVALTVRRDGRDRVVRLTLRRLV